MQPDVAVVGAGHNALTAAAVLASEGLEVVVLERLERPGGALALNCPYAIHLLHEEVVERIGLEVRMRPLPPRVLVLPDGTVLRDGELEPEAFARWESFWEEQARAFETGAVLDPRSMAEVVRALRPITSRTGSTGRGRRSETGSSSAARARGRAARSPGSRLNAARAVLDALS